MHRLINRIKENTGSLSLEMVIVTMIVFPIIVSLLIGSYSFYMVSSENTNLNFKAGRYVSTTGCSIEKLRSVMGSSSAFSGYNIIVNEGDASEVIQSGVVGEIIINCDADSDKGSEFEVYSMIDSNQNVFIRFFQNLAARKAIYVQEVTG